MPGNRFANQLPHAALRCAMNLKDKKMKKAVNLYTRLVIIASGVFAFGVNADTGTIPEPVKQLEKQGIEIIKPFKTPAGVDGWLGKYQDAGVTIYLTPDKKHAISGYMYDEKGNNLSEKIINDEIYIPAGRAMWKKLAAAEGITEGSDKASCKVVVFADPFCPYCKQFWKAVQPAVQADKIELKTLLVAVLKPESGRYASAMLSASDPAKAWHDFEMSNGKISPTLPQRTPEAASRQIMYNQHLMDTLGANGTPAIYYLSKDRRLQQIVGMPDEEMLKNLVACK